MLIRAITLRSPNARVPGDKSFSNLQEKPSPGSRGVKPLYSFLHSSVQTWLDRLR
jgi:hypothetical protein